MEIVSKRIRTRLPVGGSQEVALTSGQLGVSQKEMDSFAHSG